MKNTLGLLVAATMLHAVSALAIFDPSWERPIMEASLVEFDQTGHEVVGHVEKKLTMHRRDGQRKATMFTFSEEQQVMCVTAPCPPLKEVEKFKVLSFETDDCHSTIYRAVSRGRNSPRVELKLVDHTTSFCDIYRKYAWEVELTYPRRPRSIVRNLYGNPEAVVTIQNVMR